MQKSVFRTIMDLSYGHSVIGDSYHLIYKLTLEDGNSCFFLTKKDAEDAYYDYHLYSKVPKSTTDRGKWVQTFSYTPKLAYWDTSIHNIQKDNMTSLYTIVDHRNHINKVGRFCVDKKFIPVVENHLACCYEKGYPCINDTCSCKTAYNNGLLVIKKATPYTMQQVETFELNNIYLGSYEGLETNYAIERIVTFSGKNNKEKSGLQYYQVGGSTFTVATIDPTIKVKHQLKKVLPFLDNFACVVYGNFYSWSHLPCLTIKVRFDGIYEVNPTTEEMKNEKARLKKHWFSSAFSTLQTLTSQTLVVFQLLWLSEVINTRKILKHEKELTDVTSKPNWVGCMRRNIEKPLYIGRTLVGFFYQQLLQKNILNKKQLQNILIELAAYGIKNEYGIDKLKNLNNTVLRKLLKNIPQYYEKMKQTMIHRILNAARYQRKSLLWLLVHVFFPASYGQYLRDDEEILHALHSNLDSLEDKMDMILYNSEFAFQYPPYAVQVGATITTWQQRFPSRMNGSEERFIVWKLFKDRRCTQGHMLHPENLDKLLNESGASSDEVNITEKKFHSVVTQLVNHDVLKQVVDANGDNMVCFTNDYNMFYLFIQCVKQLRISISIGTICNDDFCLVYPSKHVLNHFHSICPTSRNLDAVSVEQITKEIFYTQTLETNHKKLYLDSKKTLLLIGLETWPFDTIVYVLHSLQKQEKNVTMHFFGYDALPKITTPRRRFLPLMEDLLQLELPTSRKRIDNAVDELMIKTKEDLERFLSKERILDYVIVVHTKKDLQAVKQMQLGFILSEDRFKIGDTVITPSGFISTIRRLFYYRKDISTFGMEKHLYLGTEIEVKNDTNTYRANQLKHAFVILSNQLVTPLPKVILYGAIPNYTKELFESGFATERLVYLHYESLDDQLSKKFNNTIELHADRTTPFYSCLKEFTQKKQAIEENRQIEVAEKRKRKLQLLFAQQRKKHKEYGK